MNFKAFLCALIFIELSFIQSIDGKRSFGITGRRSKSKSPNVRRGQHGHDGDDHVPLPKPPTPSNSKKNIGWNTNQPHSGTNTHQQVPSAPSGPHTGINHNQGAGLYGQHNNHAPPAYGAPPAYNSHSANAYGAPPAYGSNMGYNRPHQSYNQQPPPAYSSYGQTGMMGGGMQPMMGAPMMGGANYNQGSSFGGGGLMTNLFAGLAGYQLAKAFSGGSGGHRDREVIIINNPPPNSNSNNNDGTIVQPGGQQQMPLANPIINPLPPQSEAAPSHDAAHSHFSHLSSTEIPHLVTQLTPANNEYNYWGLPQYGIPLYGFNLPSQITDYYKVDTYNPNYQQP